jgi:hypothetical protein
MRTGTSTLLCLPGIHVQLEVHRHSLLHDAMWTCRLVQPSVPYLHFQRAACLSILFGAYLVLSRASCCCCCLCASFSARLLSCLNLAPLLS